MGRRCPHADAVPLLPDALTRRDRTPANGRRANLPSPFLDYVSINLTFVLELAKRKEYTIGRKPIVGLLIALIGPDKNIPSRAANSEGVARESGDFSWQGIVYQKHRDGTSA